MDCACTKLDQNTKTATANCVNSRLVNELMLFALLSFAPIVFLRLSDEFVRLLRVDEIDLDPAFGGLDKLGDCHRL